MDLAVVGRHALLFDDDAAAEFVNSADALVDWNSLSIDRYDVRHLLFSPPPPRNRRIQHSPSLESDLEAELEHERFLDLSSQSVEPDEEDMVRSEKLEDASGYRAVPFSYGDPNESTTEKADDADCIFHPPFSVPVNLLQHLPPSEKLHQIIARTAVFVSKHGGQSEIVLRVKQGSNPTFGFLMPDHKLHPYFRFLVDHQDILTSDRDGTSPEEDNKFNGGALSLLGSIYGSVEDEDAQTENANNAPHIKKNTREAVDTVSASDAHEQKQREPSCLVTGKPETAPVKDKSSYVKKNRPFNSVEAGNNNGMKKVGDVVDPHLSDKKQASRSAYMVDLPILEPPSDMKKVVDKIVEFILINGKEFEAILVQQDVRHCRFPFLLPSNQYNPYYLKALQQAQEPKLPDKAMIPDKRTAVSKESDTIDIPFDYDNKKEKFKMVIGKSKKDEQDAPSARTQPAQGISVDTAAAAAILRAATKGMKYPDLAVLSKNPLDDTKRTGHGEEPILSEAKLTEEQRLKAERLKRAKLFAAMLKNGTEMPKAEQVHGLLKETLDSGASNLVGTDRGDSGALNFEKKDSADYNERMSKRSYRLRSKRHEEAKEEKNEIKEHQNSKKRRSHSRSKRHEEEEEEEEEEETKRHKHGRKSRSRNSSHHSRDRHRHRKRHSHSHSRKHDCSSSDQNPDSADEERRHSSRSAKHRKRSHTEREIELEEGEIKSDQSKASEGGSPSREGSIGLSKSGRDERIVPSQLSESTRPSDDLRAKIRAMLMANM